MGAMKTMRAMKVMKSMKAQKRTVTESWPSELQQAIKAEVQYWMDLSRTSETQVEFGTPGEWCCPMCATRSFTKKGQLQHHMKTYHAKNAQGALSSKLLKVVACQADDRFFF